MSGLRSNSRTNVGAMAVRLRNPFTCKCLGNRGKMRHLMHISPCGTRNGHVASFTSMFIAPLVSSDVRVRVGPTLLS